MRKEDLRIVFMGTPEFAVETLKALVENDYNVVGVVTQPDKPVGRHGSVLQPPAVKQYSLERGLPVLQPAKMKDPAFVEQLRGLRANLQVVVAFRMLPEVVWAMPEYGTFNVHAALLPNYRGAAPINWAVINGETETGVTTFFLDHDIDTGRIIMQLPFDIPDTADAEYVYDGLMHLGAEICLKTLQCIVEADGRPASEPQREADNLKPAPKLVKENCEVDWHQPVKRVYDFIRGLSPYPGAWSTLTGPDGREVTLKFFRTTKTGRPSADVPGRIVVDKRRLYVTTGDCQLQIDELQQSGKKRMDAASFLNGMKGW
ncbi:MAG: methionyl-tRNA formyltransferase [Prevotella sp.]|jgi:methionyl-tRNA formyltransferase|nr:methionyl-tRNA formyltransferase [Prevotella sp.]